MVDSTTLQYVLRPALRLLIIPALPCMARYKIVRIYDRQPPPGSGKSSTRSH